MKGSRAFEMRRRFPKRAHGWLGVYRVLLWAGLAPLLFLIGARLAGYDPTWITIVQILPTVILAVVAFLLIDSSLATPSPGASENASGVIACMDLAKRLDTSPVQHLDIWLVLTGGSTCFGEGMRSFFSDKRLRDPERRTTVVELQAVGAGTICFRASQGAGIGIQPPERLVEALAGTPPATEPVSGDAVAARSAGIDAITLTGLDDGLPQPWRSTMADLPVTVDQAILDHAVATAERMIRNLDTAAAGEGEPAQAIR